jgi:hypothetical protein
LGRLRGGLARGGRGNLLGPRGLGGRGDVLVRYIFLGHGLFKILDAFAEIAANITKPARAEDQDDYDQNNEQVHRLKKS